VGSRRVSRVYEGGETDGTRSCACWIDRRDVDRGKPQETISLSPTEISRPTGFLNATAKGVSGAAVTDRHGAPR
jgi:hypothetical protein